jgi:hypothetical protein
LAQPPDDKVPHLILNDWIKERTGLERDVEDIKVVEQEQMAEDEES